MPAKSDLRQVRLDVAETSFCGNYESVGLFPVADNTPINQHWEAIYQPCTNENVEENKQAAHRDLCIGTRAGL